MGCDEARESNYPLLICFFQVDNEDQKEFCLKLKDKFHYEKPIKYEIRSSQTEPFSIKLKKKNNIYDINTSFVNSSEEEVEKTLNEIYKILDEK